MGKSSFSLFETIIAITVISILVGGFLKSANYSTSSLSNLQNIKNIFLSNDTTSLDISNIKYEYTLNSKTNVTIVNEGIDKKLQYNKNNIFFQKHLIIQKNNSLNFKEYK